MLRRAALLLLVLFLPSCGRPSYPKERLAESLAELCRREYNLEVKAQVAGTTLGCMAMIPGLIEELRKSAGENPLQIPPLLIESRYESESFDFRILKRTDFVRVGPREKARQEERSPREPAKPIKQLQQVSTAIHRVSLSTDAPLEFYRLIARDPLDHLDVIFSGHIMDSKRVQFYAISMGELQERSEFAVRYQPEVIAQETVASFLLDVRRRPLPQLLSRYTAPAQRFGDMLPKFLAVAVEMKGREDWFAGQDWPVLQVDRSTVLVHVPLQEIGDPGAFLFTVEAQDNVGAFSDIQRLPSLELPAAWQHLGPPERWAQRLHLEPMSLPTFLAEQVAKRVASEFRAFEPPEEPSGEEAGNGGKKGLPPARSGEPPSPEPAAMEEVTRLLAETAAYVMKSYEFRRFDEITVIDGLKGTRWVISAAELPLFRRKPAPELKAIP